MLDQITPSDLQLFSEAQAALQAARATFQFVTSHIGKVYQISPQDQVDLRSGVITRFVAPVPEPAP